MFYRTIAAALCRATLSLGALLGSGAAMAQTAPAHVLPDGSVPPALIALRTHVLDAPTNELTFRNMDQLFQTRPVARSGPVRALPRADAALPAFNLDGKTLSEDAWEDRTFTNAMLVMHDGRIVHESYRNNSTEATHFISFSMAKSITSILVGIAIDKGYIHSVDDLATTYVPELKGSGYDGVTIRQILEMRSGVDYEERYDFGKTPSAAAKIFLNAIVANSERFADTAPRLGRKWAPGSRFNYSTLDTSVLGWILERAVHQPLATFTEQVLWQPMGMESYGYWLADGGPSVGRELNGMGYNATLRDFARIGQMMLDGGRFNGRQIVSADWVRQSTAMRPLADTGSGKPVSAKPVSNSAEADPFAGWGYGFQWWKVDQTGGYTALGLQGQFIYVHPASHTVIVKLSFFPPEGDPAEAAATRESIAYFGTLVKWAESQPTG